jgi:PAS domain S-box-containing protein
MKASADGPRSSAQTAGLRARLMILVFFAIIPGFGLMLYHANQDRLRKLDELQADALRTSELCAANVAQVVEGARQTLIALAYSEPVRSGNTTAASALFSDVLRHSRAYRNIAQTHSDGLNIASALPMPGKVNSGSQPWFKQLQAKRGFAIGDYQIGKITGMPGINIGIPLPDQPENQPLAAVNVSLKLETLQACISEPDLPPNAILNIIDRTGIVLARNPPSETLIGRSSKAYPTYQAAAGNERGFREARGLDGVSRLYHFAEVPNSERSLFVGVGVSKESLAAESRYNLIKDVLWLAFFFLGAMLWSSFAAERWVLGPVRMLSDISRRIAEGDFNVRALLDKGAWELQQLARAFDSMTSSLREYTQRLRESEQKFRAITTSASDAIIMLDSEGRVSFWNEAAEKLLGYSQTEAIGMDLHGCLAPARYSGVFDKKFPQFQATGEGEVVGRTLELEAVHRDGFEISVELSISSVQLDGRWNAVGIMRDVTDRKRAESELRKHREHLEELVRERTAELERASQELDRFFNVTMDLLCIADSDGSFVRLNQAWTRILGYTQEELLANRFLEFIHPEDVQATLQVISRLAEQKEVMDFTNRYRCRDGSYRWIEWRSVPSGPLIYSAARDITERREMEDRIARLTRLKEQLVGGTPLADKLKLVCDEVVRTFDADFARIWVTRGGDLCHRGCIHEGAAEGQGVCRDRTQCLHLLASSGRYVHLDGCHKRVPLGSYKIGRIASGAEARFVTNDVVNDPAIGDPQWARELGLVSFAGFRLFSDQGKPMGVLALFSRRVIADRDINMLADLANTTSQFLLEGLAKEALLESDATARTLLNAIPESAYLMDDKYIVLAANETVASRLGTVPGHMIGKNVFDFVTPEVAVNRMRYLKQALETGKLVHFEDERHGRIIDNFIAPVRDLNGAIHRLAVVGVDITVHRQAQAELKKLLAEVERSNRELEQFAYVASHDLQEPLRLVSAYTQLLLQRYQDRLDEGAEPLVRFITEGVARMQRLIQDLLLYSRISSQAKVDSPIEVESVLEDTLRQLDLSIRECQAHISHDPLPEVLGDRTQLGQLFQNLIGNAIKFRCDGKPPIIHVGARISDHGGEWLFSIRDNGIGIEPQFHERIFVIFQRLQSRSRYSGTGIGLAICKRIVERQGGRIWVESEKGKGATFHFTLPAKAGRA